ncbi:serine/threonine protein kinase [Rubripirellula amarantea]|nr:serine/threonine protein kinase [Rubripirellula amarantea]
MDSTRYNRVRDLFLAADELPPGEQEEFLRRETADDVSLLEEVVSLLAEHDPAAAKLEGDCAQPVAMPPTEPSSGSIALSDTYTGPSTSETFGHGRGLSDSSASDSSVSDSATKIQPRRSSSSDPGQITKQGVLRTHASPRYGKDSERSKPRSKQMPMWAERTRKSRRRASGWLWLAALLPTALVGWWTYRAVDATMQRSVEVKLSGAAENLALAADRFLVNQSDLVRSWSRQNSIRNSINELIQIARTDPDVETMRDAPQIDRIADQLRELSGHDDVKFVVWNNSFRIVASWLPDRADVGNVVHPSGAANLARVMAGETVLFGPERLTQDTIGFEPETTAPVMAVIVPVEDDEGKVSAAMLIRGFSAYEKFNRMFAEFSVSAGVDAYAINNDGIMVTEGPGATSLATQGKFDIPSTEIAANLRVCDPGMELTNENRELVKRQFSPVTVAAAGAIANRPDVRTEPYANYAGIEVVGAWKWLDRWDLGIIVEESAADSFAPTRLVRFSFLLLGSLLSVTAFLAASKLARTSTAEQAAVHPLSRYDVTGELGSGGMGVVYLARHRQLDRDVALKVLRSDRHKHDDRLRFDREAKLAASLTNPHSVMIYDYGHSEQNEAYCVMQYLKGLTLQEVVARSGHQPIGRVLSIMRQVCDALSEAHAKNLLHRDIKPQNIMLSLDKSVGDWVVVFDYGLAKPLEPDADVYQTTEAIWAGTPMYMAPERFREPGNMDPRSDIYSVGCVGYYLLAGRPPFIESDPESLFSLILSEQPIGIHIHRGEPIALEVANLISRCMAKNVDDRFASIAELGRMIDQLRIDHEWSADQAKIWWSHHGGS